MFPWRALHEGFTAPWAGLRYLAKNPALWRYGALPIVVNLLITGLLLAVLMCAGVYFCVAIHPKFGEGWLWLFAEISVATMLAIVVLAITAAAWLLLQSILCGFFYDRLARQVEIQLGIPPEQLKNVSLFSQTVDTLRDVRQLLLINAGCFAVQFIPAVGPVLGLCGSYYFTSYLLGLEYFDYPLALRGRRRAEKLDFAHRHRFHVIGLGTAVAVLVILPIINALFLTTAVIGAVLLHKRLHDTSINDPTPGPKPTGEAIQ